MPLKQSPPGTVSRDLNDLCPCVRKKVDALIADARVTEGIAVTVVETLRDQLRQAYYLKAGVSWTARSRHLPQPPHGKALAVDLAPSEYLAMKGANWFPQGVYWDVLGALGKKVGLVWGGDWKVKDRPHFELRRCECPQGMRA